MGAKTSDEAKKQKTEHKWLLQIGAAKYIGIRIEINQSCIKNTTLYR